MRALGAVLLFMGVACSPQPVAPTVHRAEDLPTLRAMAFEIRGKGAGGQYPCRGCHEVTGWEVGR